MTNTRFFDQPGKNNKDHPTSTTLTHVKGIGPASAEKLASAGIATAKELAAATP